MGGSKVVPKRVLISIPLAQHCGPEKHSDLQSHRLLPSRVPNTLMQLGTVQSRYPCCMSQPIHSSPNINIVQAQDYRDGYANSVQVRASMWDFMLIFGAARQDSPDEVVLRNFQGIYLSPQQAKALWNLLGQNLAQYEQAFGAINLEPTQAFPAPGPGNGPIH